MKSKYLLLGGWITSRYDGDDHYIPAKQLAKLYSVDPAECVMINQPIRYEHEEFIRLNKDNYTILRPRSDGNYGGIK